MEGNDLGNARQFELILACAPINRCFWTFAKQALSKRALEADTAVAWICIDRVHDRVDVLAAGFIDKLDDRTDSWKGRPP